MWMGGCVDTKLCWVGMDSPPRHLDTGQWMPLINHKIHVFRAHDGVHEGVGWEEPAAADKQGLRLYVSGWQLHESKGVGLGCGWEHEGCTRRAYTAAGVRGMRGCTGCGARVRGACGWGGGVD